MAGLRRSTNKIVAGVIGGFAEWLNVDPTLLRIFSLISTLLFAVVGFIYFGLFGVAAVLLVLIFMYFLLAAILQPSVSNSYKEETKNVFNKSQKKELRYAGLLVRGLAFLVDMIISIIVFVLLLYILFIASINHIYEFLSLFYFASFMIVFFVTAIKNGKTIGKKIFGIKIVNKNGNLPSVGDLFLREFIKFLLINMITLPILFIITFINIFFIWYDKKNQGLYDKITNTYVVYEDKREN